LFALLVLLPLPAGGGERGAHDGPALSAHGASEHGESLAASRAPHLTVLAASAFKRVALLPARGLTLKLRRDQRAGAAAAEQRPGRALVHFHRLRRIPRLNAEEPPWA
jgi:hypothetical protein